MTKERVSTLLSIMFLTIIGFSIAQAADIITKQKHIVLDPGHGIQDTGLVTPAGIQEQQVTLELAEQIALELPDTFQVRLTRRQNSSETTGIATQQQRAVFANQMGADLFVSIHLQQTRASTPLISYHDSPGTTPAVADQARQMAQITARLFKSRQNTQARILKTWIIPIQDLLMPGILIEPVSIFELPSNPTERKDRLLPFARTIAAAIQDFFSAQN